MDNLQGDGQPALHLSLEKAAGPALEALRAFRAALGADLMFGGPIDILLFLASEDRGDGITTSRCCGAVPAPRTTALRWIKSLSARGLVEQQTHAADRRVTMLRLTPEARSALTAWLFAISTGNVAAARAQDR